MDSKKFLVGGITGGITNFLLGWVVWGMLLAEFMQSHMKTYEGLMRGEEHMLMWAMVVANLSYGFLISFVLSKANINSAGGGATAGAVIGLFLAIFFDFILHAQMDLMNTTAILVDIAASVVVSSIVGAVVGWMNSRFTKAA